MAADLIIAGRIVGEAKTDLISAEVFFEEVDPGGERLGIEPKRLDRNALRTKVLRQAFAATAIRQRPIDGSGIGRSHR